MELLWRPRQYNDNNFTLFTHIEYYHYSPPPNFHFDAIIMDDVIKDDPTL